MRGDDDTYIRDAEQAELHHACNRKSVLVRVTTAAPPTGSEESHAPIIDLYNWSQPEVLSPSQCPAHFPLDGKVDLVTTMPRLPVTFSRALQENRK